MINATSVNLYCYDVIWCKEFDLLDAGLSTRKQTTGEAILEGYKYRERATIR
jgi:hypothetical protein